MPRRNSAPVQRSSRNRINLPRRGSTLIVWDSTGKAQQATVLHAHRRWVDIVLPDGTKSWIPTRTV